MSHLVEEHTAAYTNGEFKGTAEFRRLDLTKEEVRMDEKQRRHIHIRKFSESLSYPLLPTAP